MSMAMLPARQAVAGADLALVGLVRLSASTHRPPEHRLAAMIGTPGCRGSRDHGSPARSFHPSTMRSEPGRGWLRTSAHTGAWVRAASTVPWPSLTGNPTAMPAPRTARARRQAAASSSSNTAARCAPMSAIAESAMASSTPWMSSVEVSVTPMADSVSTSAVRWAAASYWCERSTASATWAAMVMARSRCPCVHRRGPRVSPRSMTPIVSSLETSGAASEARVWKASTHLAGMRGLPAASSTATGCLDRCSMAGTRPSPPPYAFSALSPPLAVGELGHQRTRRLSRHRLTCRPPIGQRGRRDTSLRSGFRSSVVLQVRVISSSAAFSPAPPSSKPRAFDGDGRLRGEARQPPRGWCERLCSVEGPQERQRSPSRSTTASRPCLDPWRAQASNPGIRTRASAIVPVRTLARGERLPPSLAPGRPVGGSPRSTRGRRRPGRCLGFHERADGGIGGEEVLSLLTRPGAPSDRGGQALGGHPLEGLILERPSAPA